MEGFNSEPNKRLRLTPPLASRGAGTIIAGRQSAPRQNTGRWAREIFTTEYTEAVEPYLKDTETGLEGKIGLEGFNSEPNKSLPLTRSLASRGAGTIGAARQSGPRQIWERSVRILFRRADNIRAAERDRAAVLLHSRFIPLKSAALAAAPPPVAALTSPLPWP